MKTAEATLKAFFKAWKNNNPKQMHINTTKTWQSTHNKSAFLAKELNSFEIVSSNENGPKADFKVILNGDLMQVRLVCERAPYRTSSTEQSQEDINSCKQFGISSNVAWGVNPISFTPCM